MIKKIAIEQLQLGMYIHDLNCGWLDHGFLRTRFLLKSDASLDKIRQIGIRELYIDTERGLDVSLALTEEEVTEALEQDLALVAQEIPKDERSTPLAVERIQAKRILNEAIGVIGGLMNDARLGKPVELEHANALIDEMISSVFRNPDALLAFTRIRRVGRYTLEHSVNVAVLLIGLARRLGMERSQIQELGLGGLLHDMGKVMVPSAILNKPGRLTDDEFAVMRTHVNHSAEILSRIPGIPDIALEIARDHHERTDGSGYPDRKCGTAIGRAAQMAAIADVYDAISAERVYHKALEPHQALRKMLEWSSHHFDPELVQQFIRCVGIYPIGTLVRLRSGRLGIVVESGRDSPFQPIVRVVMDANRRRFLTVQDIDLARQGRGSEERILNAESPSAWGINPDHVLQLPS